MKKDRNEREGTEIGKKARKLAAALSIAALCVMSAGCGNTAAAGTGAAGAPQEVEETVQTTAEAAEENAASTQEAADTAASAAEDLSKDAAAEETAASAGASKAEETASEAVTGAADTAAEASTAAADADQPSAAEEEGTSETAEDPQTAGATAAAAETTETAATAETAQAAEEDRITFDGETDLEYNARQILEADENITREGALGIAAYLWQMGFGRMSGYPTINEVNGGRVLTVFDEQGLFYNIFLTPEGKIQEVEDVEGNELITLGTRAGELVKPPVSGEDVIALLEAWKEHGGHSQVVSAYNQYAGDWGRSRMSSDDLWCSETVSAAYAALGVADKIGGMASNGNTYESNARAIGAWVSGGGYVPSTGDIVITHDSGGDRHTACVVSCDGSTIHTIAGGGSSIHHSSISVGSGRITGFVVPEW